MSEFMLMQLSTTCQEEVMMFGIPIETMQEAVFIGEPKTQQVDHHTILMIGCILIQTTLD